MVFPVRLKILSFRTWGSSKILYKLFPEKLENAKWYRNRKLWCLPSRNFWALEPKVHFRRENWTLEYVPTQYFLIFYDLKILKSSLTRFATRKATRQERKVFCSRYQVPVYLWRMELVLKICKISKYCPHYKYCRLPFLLSFADNLSFSNSKPVYISTSDEQKPLDQRWNNIDRMLKMKQNPTSDFQRCTTDTTSVPNVETTSKQRCTMLIQRCINVVTT